MALITKRGRELAAEMYQRDEITRDQFDDTAITLSLIVRHTKTLRRYEEMMCGDGIHSGEWVNANYTALQARYDALETRLTRLIEQLPLVHGEKITGRIGGDPRGALCLLYVPRDDRPQDAEVARRVCCDF